MKSYKYLQKQGSVIILNLKFLIFTAFFLLFFINIFSINVKAQTIKDVNGLSEISLNRKWAEEVFTDKSNAELHNWVELIREGSPGDTKIDLNTAGGPMSLGGKIYKRGVGVNYYSDIRVSLSKPVARFTANIGLDDNIASSGFGSVAFHLSVGGNYIFSTPVMHWRDGMKMIDVALNGNHTFDLIVDQGGDGHAFDQADWADAKIIMQDGSEIWLDDLLKQWQLNSDLPFSFVYGNKQSADLIGTWKRKVSQEQLDSSRILRTLTITDPVTGLEVKAICTIYTDCPGIDWTLYFTNKGNSDTDVLEKIKTVDVTFWPGLPSRQPVLHRLNGGGGAVDDWMPYDDELQIGKRIDFAPVYGRSSMGACPFFNLDWGSAGVITAIGWTGQWEASVQDTSGALRVTAGMQNLHLKLHPGESIRSPRIMQLYWQGGDETRSYNLFRRTMLHHILPQHNGNLVTPPIASVSSATYDGDKGTESEALSHVAKINGLGFEVVWMDAYYGKDDFPTVGNLVFPLIRAFNLKRFPNGMKPVSEAVHKAGMKFLMWFEYERICSGTLMAIEHPEWVVLPQGKGWGMFNLAIPEAREYITNYLSQSIMEYGINWLRIDNAVFYKGLWAQLDKDHPDRVGLSEIRYVEGHYRLWDDLLKKFPDLDIDNCASGGGRIDLETCSRSIPLWRTDATIVPCNNNDFNQAALQNQVMTAGLSRYVPFSTSGQAGASPYCFRSGFNCGIIDVDDVRGKDFSPGLFKSAINEGKRLRKYYSGNYYPLTEVNINPKLWSVIQYHRSQEQDGMVVLFRRHQSPYSGFVCNLREIDPDARYKVTVSKTYQQSEPLVMKGADLQNIKIDVDECPGSVVLEYCKLSD
jgi:alpha-galactosidase